MKKITVYLSALICLLLIVQIGRSFFSSGVETQLVTSGNIEDVVSTEAFIVKNETIYEGSIDGYVQPLIDEGERAGVGQKLVTVYTDNVNNDLKNQLDMVNAKISTIEQSTIQKEIFENDKVKLESMSADEVLNLPKIVYDGDYEKIPVTKGNVNAIIDRIKKVTGQDGPQADTLESLKERKSQLESQLGNSKTDVYCKNSGVFSLNIDGLENILTPDNIMLMTPSKYKELKPDNDMASGVCKIVDNTSYFILACVDSNRIKPLSVGNAVAVRFSDLSSEEMNGTVSYISTEENGKVVVAVEVNMYVPDIYSTRKTNVDIIKSTYTGLSIPVSAIRMENNKTGIYVMNSNIMKFKEINILYNSNEYAIIEEVASLDNSSVKLYDEVVVKAKKYENGLLVD